VDDPGEALQVLAEILVEREDWPAAMEVLKRLERSNGEDPVVLRQMGAAAAAMGDAAGAERLLRRAIALDPELVAAHLSLGHLFTRQERWGEAIEVARTALEVLPGYAESLLLLATAEDGRGSTGGALDALVELLTADAYHLGALRKLGQTLARAGRYTDARRALHRLVRLDPMSLEARYELGGVLQREGRLSVALTLWRSVVESGGGTPIAASAAEAIRRALADRTGFVGWRSRDRSASSRSATCSSSWGSPRRRESSTSGGTASRTTRWSTCPREWSWA
jgi:tetratricopeptide (TPR) repeat protein